MDLDFAELMHGVVAKYAELVGSPLLAFPLNAAVPNGAGVYVFYEAGVARYVGRAGKLRERLRQHQADGSKHTQAAFASRLAKRICNLTRVYNVRRDSPEHFSQNPAFLRAFVAAKLAIREMQFRCVEERDPTRQALLEIYAATVLKAECNDFDNH